MNIAQLIKSAAAQGVFLFQQDGQLGFRLSVEQFPPALKTDVLAHKAQIIAYLAKADQQQAAISRPKIAAVADISQPIIPSYGQQRIWFIDRLDEGSSQYNSAMALKVSGDFNVDIAEQAIALIVKQHQVLRTVFIDEQGEPMQVVKEDVKFSLKRHSLLDMSKAQQQQTVLKMIKQDAASSFDLSQDLMLRASYLALGENDGVLLFNIHHIASDGWSSGLLMESFLKNYQGLQVNPQYQPKALDIQYADYACWQRQWLSGEVLEKQISYWQQQLTDVPEVHSLPLDFTRPEQESYQGARVYGHLDKHVADQLQAVASSHQMTLFMLLHGALCLLLARLSNNNDIVLGTPIANRLQNELKPLIGFFTNTLVLRVDTDHQDLSSYLEHVRKVNLDAQSHQDIPFEFLLEHCDISRDLAHSPLFQIMFNMDTNQSSSMSLPGVSFSPLEGADVQAMFDLDVNAQLSSQGIELLWVYDTGLFKHQSVELFNRCYEQLLVSLVEAHLNDNNDLAKLNLLKVDDALNAMTLANQQPLAYDTQTMSFARFCQLAKQQPEQLAVVAKDKRLSYGQLAQKAKQLICYLHQQHQDIAVTGTASEQTPMVGVMMGKTVDAPLCYLAVMGSGYCYVPINPELPIDRIESIIEQANIRCLICDSQFDSICQQIIQSTRSSNGAISVHYVDQLDWQQLPVSNEILASITIKPSDLAYCIFTSGTTGQPKGVLIEQGAILAQYYAWQQVYLLDSTTKVHMQLAGLAFDVSIGDFTRSLLSGGAVVMVDKPTMLAPAELLGLIGREKANYIEFVPAVLVVFLAYLKQLIAQGQTATLAQFATINIVVVGSDAWNLKQHNEAQQVLDDVVAYLINNGVTNLPHGGIDLVNSYGLTECSVDSSYYRSDWFSKGKASASNIGKALGNVYFYVLDANQQLLPVGAMGELYVGGPSVGRGYLGLSQLTKQKFFDGCDFVKCLPQQAIDSLAKQGYQLPQRLYRSGDMVRLLDNGTLDFYGRGDDQIKIRGYRIELGDIQAQVVKHPLVESTVLKVVTAQAGQKLLVAYLLPVKDCQQSQSDIIKAVKGHLVRALPDYMVPFAYVVVDSWPLNVNGKIDKKALPEPDLSNLDEDVVTAQGDKEQILLTVWSELLKIPPSELSVEANFFALGGDSILSIQVVSRAASQGLYFSVKDLFTAQSIRQLALIATTDSDGQARFISPQQAQVGTMTLLPIQMQFFEDLTDWHWDNQSLLFIPPAKLDLPLLKGFVSALIERHDALRLAFDTDEQGNWQAQHVPFSTEMLSDCVSQQTIDCQSEQDFIDAANEVQSSLAPRKGILFKAVLFDVQGTWLQQPAKRLLLTIHHLVVDGVSWRVILSDLEKLYSQFLSFEEANDAYNFQLGLKTAAYAQWGAFLVEYSQSQALADEQDYWLKAANSSVKHWQVALPSVGSEPDLQRGFCAVQLSAASTKKLLNQAPRAYGTQINELLLAGVLLALYRSTQVQGLRIDLEGHGREPISDSIDLSETVGWFTSVFPLTLEFDPNCPIHQGDIVGAIICQVKEQYRRLPGNGLGFGVLKYINKIPELVNMDDAVMVFNYLGQFDQGSSQDEEPIASDSSNQDHFTMASHGAGLNVAPTRMDPHQLMLDGMVTNGQLNLQLGFLTTQQRFATDSPAMEGLLDEVINAIDDIANHCADKANLLKGQSLKAQNQQYYYTPADFPLAHQDISASDLDVWQQQLKEQQHQLVDLYPATGMQQGMLFHSLLSQGSYVSQTSLVFSELDLPLFEQAWQQVLDHHDIFRTSFVGLETGVPMQRVQARATMHWHYHDICHLSLTEQRQYVIDLEASDKAKGCDITQAPLMRMSVIKRSLQGTEQGSEQESEQSSAAQSLHLIWTVHHALLDGWCTPIVFAQVTACYGALLAGKTITLPQVAPFVEYAKWLADQDKTAANEFWQQQLSPLTGPTPLPLHRQNGESHGALGVDIASEFVELDKGQSEALSNLAKQAKTTVNVLLQGAWALLLSRYAEQQVVAFGATTSGRPPQLADAERMVGLFINTLPVVIDTSDIQLADWFEILHQQLIARESFSYTPLQDIQRLASFNGQLFDSVLIFENFPVDESIGEKVEDAQLHLQSIQTVEETNYEITLLASFSARLSVKIDFRQHSFNPSQSKQIAKHLQQILLSLIAKQPNQILAMQLAEVEMLAEQEKQQILELSCRPISNLPEPDYDFAKDVAKDDVYGHFAYQVATKPDSIAISFAQQQLSYRQLEQRVGYLAAQLNVSDSDSMRLIGVCLPRGIDLVAGMLAVLRVGATYVPIDPNYPQARVEQVIAATNMAEMVINPDKAAQLALDSEIKCFDFSGYQAGAVDDADIWQLGQRQSWQKARNAYVIYTSGSTGTPKGVVISSAAFNHFNWVMNQQIEYAINPNARVLALTTVSFDIAGLELIAPLCFGAQVIMASQEQVADPQQIADLIAKRDVTVMQATPGHWQQLVQSNWRGKADLVGLCGGEAVSEAVAMAIAHRCLRAYNCYGPTEATIWSGVKQFDVKGDSKSITDIGLPLPGYQHLVLDNKGRMVPHGCVGQLHIGGAALATGYFNREDLTQSAFITHPLASSLDSKDNRAPRLYKTGDLVRMNADGSACFVGRVDSQVKIRGYRIELAEIEHQLQRHNLCKDGMLSDAIVTVDEQGNAKRLVAHLLVNQVYADQLDHQQVAATMRAHISANLPDYMLPSSFVCHQQFARTNNGKVDRKAVAQSAQGLAIAQVIAPDNQLQGRLAQVWADVLDIDISNICVQTSFFELGGDSLLTIPLVKHINTELDVNLSLKDIYELRTIAAIADNIEQLAINRTKAVESVVKLNQFEVGQRQQSVAGLFVLHPIIGFVNCYFDFAAQLNNVLPVYGVQAPYCYGHELRFNNLSELAKFYAQGIVAVQPQGPYRLAGWSAGGSIAFYVAQQLQQQGFEVDYTVMIEPSPLDTFTQYNRHQAIDLFLATVMSDDVHSDTQLRDELVTEVLNHGDENQGLVWLAQQLSQLSDSLGLDSLADSHQNLIYIKAGIDYFLAKRDKRKLQPVAINRLFTTLNTNQSDAQNTTQSINPSQSDVQALHQYQQTWRGYLNGKINHLSVPGDHSKMMEAPALEQIVAAVKDDLQQLLHKPYAGQIKQELSQETSNFIEGESDVV